MTTLTLDTRICYEMGGHVTLTGILMFDHPAKNSGITSRHEQISFPQPILARGEWGDDDLLVEVQSRYPRATVAWAIPAPANV